MNRFSLRLLRYILLPIVALLGAALDSEALPAFPGAQGFGSETVGGSGRQSIPPRTSVMRVINLQAEGPGSLQACIAAKGPRVCVFETSGTIVLRQGLRIEEPFITIAGQTAPSPGILIRGASLRIDTHDVVIQHLEVRPGDMREGQSPDGRDGVQVVGEGSYHVVIDHISVGWAVDEALSTGQKRVHDVTFSNCLAAESLWHSIHPKGPHSMGMLIGDGSKNITVRDSLFAHNVERNPRIKPGAQLEFINNVVYHWGGRYGWNLANLSDSNLTGERTLLYFAGNYYKAGPQSPKAGLVFGKPYAKDTKVFVGENIGPLRKDTVGDPWHIGEVPSGNRAIEPPFPLSGAQVKRPNETYEYVLGHAGARPGERSSLDRRIINDVRTGAGSFKDCVAGCSAEGGGWPERAVNRRSFSMPEDPFGFYETSGYTKLEHALHLAAEQVEIPASGTKQ